MIVCRIPLPVFAQGIANIPARQAWFVVGITLQAF